MSFYYPQACMALDVLLEDFKLVSDAPTQKTYPLNIVAKNLTVNINDFRTADTFTADIDFKSFPFDPRIIRACGVRIFMQDMDGLYNSDGSRKVIVPNDAPFGVGTTNALFQGFVDEDHINLDEQKRSVSFTGRDFTALFIDQKYKEQLPLDLLKMRLDKALYTIINTFPATKKIKVVNLTGGTLPTPDQFMPGNADRLGAQKSTGQHESYWDIIQDITTRCGLIAYISLDKLILTTPRNQVETADQDLKIVYGHTIKNLMMKRKLGRLRNFNLAVRSRFGKNVTEAKIPEEATESWCRYYGIPRAPVIIPVLLPTGQLDTSQGPAPLPAPGTTSPFVQKFIQANPTTAALNGQKAPYIVFPVPNISNKDQLIRIGQNAYEEYSRQELEGSFETREMTYKDGDITFDLTQIDYGHSIKLEIQPDDQLEIARIATPEERINYLLKRGYSEEVATVLANPIGKFSPRFFTKAATISLSQDTGFSLKVDFVNVLDLRNVSLK